MMTDVSIREQSYTYFLSEAPELLQTIEQELFTLPENYSIAKVHNIMRATHTIKGGAAIVELDVINKIAHSLEDVIRALYNPDVVIDAELQTLLLQAYESLRLPITAELTGSSINNEEVLQRAASVFAQLHEKLGDALNTGTHIPTSVELGFDIVQSIFETGVTQRLESIAEAVKNSQNTNELADFLRSQAEVFLGLAESLNLPGFGDIAQTTLAALEANPTSTLKIAELALADFQQGKEAILAGDRSIGGQPSPALQQLSQIKDFVTEISVKPIDNSSIPSINPSIVSTELRSEISEFYEFLITYGIAKNQPLKPTTAKFYLKVIRYILGWFNHELQVPPQELCLSLLIPQSQEKHNCIENWLNPFFEFLPDEKDSPSLCIYRQGIILKVLLSVAIFHYGDNNDLIKNLQNKINFLSKEYKKNSPINSQDKNWLNSQKLQKLLEIKEILPPDFVQPETNLIETIWGETVSSISSIEVDRTQSEEVISHDSAQIAQSLTIPEPIVTEITGKVIEVIPDSTLKISKQVENQEQPANNSRQNSFIRVNVEELERLNYLAGELLIYQRRRNLHDEQLREIIEQLFHQLQRHQKTLNELRELPLQMQNCAAKQKQNFANVDFDSLEMENYTEFNVTLSSALEESLQLQETADSIDLLIKQSIQIQEKKQRLTINIIDNLVEARMLPLENILNRFPQMIKNLGNMYGKLIDLKLTGTQVLVDKAIAEKLYDPLLQLVRNAFDHGIELPERRREFGKPERGLIEICAYHQGSQTIIEVRDDGQGIDLEKIYTKAIELGFLSADNATKNYTFTPTEEELLELLFLPGFSTAIKVSEISGRGVGLDIVRSQLHSLNGSVAVQSFPYKGTTFILKIPFSMTTDKLMLVQAGGIVYALLLDSIEKILLPSAHTIKEFEGKKVLHWNTGNDERIISICPLSELIYYNNYFVRTSTLQNKLMTDDTGAVMKNPVLLIRQNQGLLGLEVDQIIGEQELVIRPLGQTISPPKFVYGCSSLANGNLILVIDGALLLDTSHQMQAAIDVRALPAASTSQRKALPMSFVQSHTLPPASTINAPKVEFSLSRNSIYKTPKVVLVVDDAISLRQTLSLTLQKFGYQILQAQNGIEALEQLQQHPDIQVMISDLEMPRMNGFELLSQIRQNPNLANIPVAVLTSRSSEKHRRLALELGAKAYITKPYLEHELISTIDGLIQRDVVTFENV
ncbi:hypothetical protein NUACC21_77640 [Scytonema sp. NUACC21]